ncbi:hypothetical protein FOPG_19125 [Fusarium oxysporum f. sp. conglutinans race 2 54008]|uniref:Uncharacterized protein n=1 Tax=Fusarium oxysporum f. sp. conglutinans race 2 54008 TaxID=1089457 RepID=X0GMV2_FUSOX|nr:hypothetical protein FOPG_19125 [Fusarium oxysporum f. sp. conglutinans race 2 54008]
MQPLKQINWSWSDTLRASVTPILFEALHAGGVDWNKANLASTKTTWLPGSNWDRYNGAGAGGAPRRPRLWLSSCSGSKIRCIERIERYRFGSLAIPRTGAYNRVSGGWLRAVQLSLGYSIRLI